MKEFLKSISIWEVMGKSLVSWFLTHGVEYFLIGYVCVLNCCSDRSLLTLFLLFVIVQ